MSEALLKAMGDAMEADDRPAMLDAADQMLTMDPTSPEGLYGAGMAFFRSGNRGLATVLLNAASQVRPNQPEIWNNLACAMQDWHPHDAVAILKRALEAREGFAPALSNLVGVYSQLGKWREAEEIAAPYLEQLPDDADVRYNRALVLMQMGLWKDAWPLWRAGLGGKFRKIRHGHLPRWQGEGDATVVVYGEQGLGDEILCVSLLERAYSTGANIILECDARLEGLFRRSLPGVPVYGTRLVDQPAWLEREKPTHQLEGLGLGELFCPEPYRRGRFLTPDPAKAAMARAWLDALGPGKKIGLAWTGGVQDWDRAQRSIRPPELGPIVTSPGCRFISLEYLDGPMPEGVIAAPWFTAKGVDYDLTMALIDQLDMVISVPTTVVEAAGALGKPCWVLCPQVPPWRFAEAAGDTAWIYESVKVLRRKGGNWSPVIARAAVELRALMQQKEAA